MQQLATFAAGTSATPHRGFPCFDLETREHTLVTICGTSASGLTELADGAAAGRMCQTCERGEAVLMSQVLRPEVRLLATARSTTAAGHYLIDETSVAYCGKQLGDDAPTGDKVCKVCETLRKKVATFSQQWNTEQAGYEVEAEAPIGCDSCEWVGRYAEGTTKAYQEWVAHGEVCPVLDGHVCSECRGKTCRSCHWTGQPQPAQEENTADTWHGTWLADEDGQQLTLDGTRPDAQQGALFVA